MFTPVLQKFSDLIDLAVQKNATKRYTKEKEKKKKTNTQKNSGIEKSEGPFLHPLRLKFKLNVYLFIKL